MTERIEAALEASPGIDDRNRRYFEENLAEIRAEHAGRHVAVVNGEVAGSVAVDAPSPEIDRFLDRLREEYSDEAVAAALVQYVAGEEEVIL